MTIVHNAYDHDLTGTISVGASSSALQPGSGTGAAAALAFRLPATSAAVASDWVTGVSTLGNVSWTFRVEVPVGEAETYLPPSSSNPWWLTVDEGGYANRSGRLASYRLIWHTPGGDQVWEGGPVPMQTWEGGTTRATVPAGIVGVGSPPSAQRLRFGPNPVAAGDWVTFVLPTLPGGALQVFNPAGRKVAQVPIEPTGAGALARWMTRDAAGRPLPSGVYFAHAGGESIARIVVLRH
jgi:hypothetical protein